MMRGVSAWTTEIEDFMKASWQSGKSDAAVARKIYAKFGATFSRNAIIGKRVRMGLRSITSPLRPTHPRGKRDGRKSNVVTSNLRKSYARTQGNSHRVHEVTLADQTSSAPVPAAALNVSFMELEHHHCRWPTQDSPWRFCGLPKEGGSSYCACHKAASVDRRMESIHAQEVHGHARQVQEIRDVG